MPPKHKRQTDFEKGRQTREVLSHLINQNLSPEYKMERMHQYLRTMRIDEIVKNNITEIRITPASLDRACGLDYYLTKGGSGQKIPFRFIIYEEKTGNIYIKLPKEYVDYPFEFLELLKHLNYHIIICSPLKERFSTPAPIKTFIDYWAPHKLESKGNRNRLNFRGPMRHLYMVPLTKKDIFNESVIQKIENLL